jgi:hypothetical protein
MSDEVKAQLIATMDAEGFAVSEEESGYTCIVFDCGGNGRLTQANGDSFVQALDSLVHDHRWALPPDLEAQIDTYRVGSEAASIETATRLRVAGRTSLGGRSRRSSLRDGDSANPAFAGMIAGMRTAELKESIWLLARQLAEARGLDFEAEGQQIIAEALQQGHDNYHQRIAELSSSLMQKQVPPVVPAIPEQVPSPMYEFLREHGEPANRVVDKHHPSTQPEIPEGYRLFDVYDGSGKYSAMCVDVTDPKDWQSSCENGYENWGGRLACILISEEALKEFKKPV